MPNFKKLARNYEKNAILTLQELVKIDSTFDPKTVSPNTPYGKGVDRALDALLKLSKEHGFKVEKTLNRCGCNVTVVPYDSAAEDILAMHPDGVVFTDGPGNPEDVPETIAALKALLGKVPLFGEGLGHQLLAIAYGGKTVKMKFGHRGCNYPVRNVKTGKIEITSQNHSYAVDEESLKGTPLAVTGVNVLDGSVESLECAADGAFSIQYHPDEASFDKFTALMEEKRNA